MTADLTGWSTLALDFVATLLAVAAFARIIQSQRGEKRRFEFEAISSRAIAGANNRWKRY